MCVCVCVTFYGALIVEVVVESSVLCCIHRVLSDDEVDERLVAISERD